MPLAPFEVLPRNFYNQPAIRVARSLLGKVLRHEGTSGIIVETEAYLGGDDLAAHSARGMTDRTRVIFGPPGHAYVYFIYGMYECLNVVAEPEGKPGCVLIRALEPIDGLEEMQRRRSAARKLEQLASGRGQLTQALGITRVHNGTAVASGPSLITEPGRRRKIRIVTTPRIGISQCIDWPLRFVVADSPFVSRRN